MTRTLAELLRGQYTPVTDADAAEFRAAGWWPGKTIRSVLSDAAARYPDRVALIGHRAGEPTAHLTYREFDGEANRVASALAAIGVGAGDVVALMLPNWIEYCALVFGINEIGAVYTGIPVSYGERQMIAILRRAKAKALVIPRRWRSTDHLALARRLREEIPSLEHIVVIGDDGAALGPGEHAWTSFVDVPTRSFDPRDSGELCYLGFTSGTTGEPKGAMHTHDTLLYPVQALADHVGPTVFGDPMRQLVASPVGHHTGYVWGILFTVYLAGTGVYVDRWEPNWGVRVIRDEGVTAFFGAPTFLQDMMRTPLADDPDCPLECLVIAGSSVPRTLPAKAGEALGAYIAPAWGMTECSIMSCCTPAEPAQIQGTDGSIFAGSQVRVVDASGADVPVGVTGHLLMRGPGVVLGYYDRPDATDESFLPGLWLKTGDTASIDEHGWLSLRGRSKDIIIRGGENIPVTDVETLLFDHPAVINAALVGYPDERLGERACAVLVTRAGSTLDLPALCDYLLARGLSKHYLPERLVLLDELPTTQSGKIQKFKLRGLVAADQGGLPRGSEAPK
ncbi:AMP-binding protein [Amycolatopsis alkalitolerans]|uniref:Cyclohexanecarboxylate-CoA ligase n=1 Tax=Amycolatopsis alkalitolerans TaxID=2547244 RepID=A0A5C4M7L8_9PSEU|nr:AMP-binding protein [Amycolatopsis alkalitolerans]TNC29458.1 cyclohexanecarboxylate-CoA ligase [Amycolatopsis alkalitolerans]